MATAKIEYNKEQLYFDPNDTVQREASAFVSLCGRKKTKILSYIIHDFIRTNRLDLNKISNNQLNEFMKAYAFQKENDIFVNNTDKIENVVSEESIYDKKNKSNGEYVLEDVPLVEVDNTENEKEEIDEMRNALEIFG